MKKVVIQFHRQLYWQEYNRISNAALAAQTIVNLYNSIPTFENLNDTDWPKFARNPQAWVNAQIEKLKAKRFGSDDINISVFMKLYKIPDVKFSESSITGSEYFKMKDGTVILDEAELEAIKENFTSSTDDPVLIKKLNRIKELVSQYDALYEDLFGIKSGKHKFEEIGYGSSGQYLSSVVAKFKK